MSSQKLIDAGVHSKEVDCFLAETQEGREKIRRWEALIEERSNYRADTQHEEPRQGPAHNTHIDSDESYDIDAGTLPAIKFIFYFFVSVWILRRLLS